jgi:hypothetical protein
MNTTEGRADTRVLLDEGDATVEIVAAEKNMIKHGRRINISQGEFWETEGASG